MSQNVVDSYIESLINKLTEYAKEQTLREHLTNPIPYINQLPYIQSIQNHLIPYTYYTPLSSTDYQTNNIAKSPKLNWTQNSPYNKEVNEKKVIDTTDRVELKNYKPNLVKVCRNKVIDPGSTLNGGSINLLELDKNTYLSSLNIYSHYAYIDLNLIEGTYNPTTKRWKGRKNTPSCHDFIDLILNNLHPLTYINKNTDKHYIGSFPSNGAIILKDYLESVIEEIIKKYKGNPISEDDYSYEITTKDRSNIYFRFSLLKKKISASIDSELNNLKYIYNYIGYPCANFYKEALKKYSLLEEDLAIDTELKTPSVDTQEIERLLKVAKKDFIVRNNWNIDPPSIIEFEDNSEMIDQVYSHCQAIQGFEIKYLRKRQLAYYSDGSMNLTPDRIDNDYHKSELARGHQPLIYCGEAWCIYFKINGKDYLGGNHVYFATPEQYYEAYKDKRPDLVENFKPWSDLLWISSDWCERNGRENYHKGIDLSTPNRRRLSLLTWILGPLLQKCIESGLGNPLTNAAITSPKFNKSKWAKLRIALERLNTGRLKEEELSSNEAPTESSIESIYEENPTLENPNLISPMEDEIEESGYILDDPFSDEIEEIEEDNLSTKEDPYNILIV